MTDFDAFWLVYPRRVSRAAAEKAYAKALKVATHAQIMDGLESYMRCKPGWQEWKHASTWLNGKCWEDEWDVQETRPQLHRPATAQEVEEFVRWRRLMGGCRHDPECETREDCMRRFVNYRRGIVDGAGERASGEVQGARLFR